MSNHKDTYEAALEAVVAALDALCATKHDKAVAHQPDAEGYSEWHHTNDCGEANGVTQAYWVVQKMLAQYRDAARIGGAA